MCVCVCVCLCVSVCVCVFVCVCMWERERETDRQTDRQKINPSIFLKTNFKKKSWLLLAKAFWFEKMLYIVLDSIMYISLCGFWQGDLSMFVITPKNSPPSHFGVWRLLSSHQKNILSNCFYSICNVQYCYFFYLSLLFKFRPENSF